MKPAAQQLAVALVMATLCVSPPPSAAGAPPVFGDEKTSWHGFDRYDFLMDESDLSIKPYKAPPDEGNAVRTTVKGRLRCVGGLSVRPVESYPEEIDRAASAVERRVGEELVVECQLKALADGQSIIRFERNLGEVGQVAVAV